MDILEGYQSSIHAASSLSIKFKLRSNESLNCEVVDGTWRRHQAALKKRQPFDNLIVKYTKPDGSVQYSEVAGKPIFSEKNEFIGYRGVARDITERKLSEERIRYLANHDGLTALPNRHLFSEILNNTIKVSERHKHQFAVMFIDLDRFKNINDTLGHEAGDQLLQEIARRVRETLRPSDTVARLGGDEFVVLLPEIPSVDDAGNVARKLLAAIIQPMRIHGQELRVSASIGVCLFPEHARDEQALMKSADIAMYSAKENGKNAFCVFSEEIKTPPLERLVLEARLRRGLEQNEFCLHYQAKLDLQSNHITGVEALLRWQHPELGLVPPVQFISIAEQTGLIVEIGHWVLREACAQNMVWQRAGLPPICIAVNLSARQFADDDLLGAVERALEDSGMPAPLLEMELTESIVVQNPERAARILGELRSKGVRIAIDDFGTGCSSLGQLKTFPVDTVKVDRAFIRDLPMNTDDQAITQAIVDIARKLGLKVVAEGVETQAQEQWLRDIACDETQGFYFSKPIDAQAFQDLFQRHEPTAHGSDSPDRAIRLRSVN